MIGQTRNALISIVLSAVLAWTAGLQPARGKPAHVLPNPVMPRERLDLDRLRTNAEGPAVIRRFDPRTLNSTVLSHADDAELRVGEYLSVTGPNIRVSSITDASGQRFEALPVVLYTRGTDGRMQELVIGHHNTDLHWQSDTGDFLAELLVAVFDRNNKSAQGPLSSPVPVQFFAETGSLHPGTIEIGRLGVPYEKVEARRRVVDKDLVVKILSPFEPEGSREVRIGIVKPKLVIHVSPPAIDGLGLQSSQVTIASVDTELGSGIRYTLNATSGKLETTNLVTDSSGRGSTILHSTGLGQSVLSIKDGRFNVDERTVQFRPPIGFAIATLLGALLGASALVAYLKSGQRERDCRWPWLAGTLLGLGFTVALYAGLDFPGMPRLPEFIEGRVVPFAVAFIMALLGSTLVEKMAKVWKS